MTTPPDYNLYEYAVIRYVPRVDRGEYVNIGLIMLCKRRKWILCKTDIDEERIKALFPGADIELLRRQAKLFECNDVPFSGLPVEETYRWLTAAKSAILQTSPSHPGFILTSPEETFNQLFSDLVKN